MPNQRAEATIAASRPTRLRRHESQSLTRSRLLEAAGDVFAEKGFRGATIADVADRAGYTIGAVYSNFESKDALFRALMTERLEQVEANLAFAFGQEAPDLRGSVDERIEYELDRLQAAEDAVPARWWRLLSDYRAYVRDRPQASAELAELDRRCRDIIARHVERFAADVGIDLPMPPIVLVELMNALSEGLRAAHAEGRASMSSGEGLRLVVGTMIRAATRGANS
ncbi:MAG TPA: TetR/AcrR family transcriptional regulator [Candidatus Limnocylindria bacterium]